MLNRSNRILLALLGAQIILLAATALLTGGGESRSLEPLLAGIAVEDIDHFSFTDDLDNALTFARGDAGWVLPDADDFPLDSAKIDEILAKLTSLESRRLVASKPANFARLEVKEDDFRRRIDLEAAGQARRLYLGGSGGVDTVYARLAERNMVYLASGLSSWELSTQTSTWLDALYVNLPQDDLLEIAVSNAQGSFTFRRDGEGWLYAGLDEGSVFEDTRLPVILRNAASIRMQAPLGLDALDDYGLDEPQALVEVKYRQLIETESDAADGDEAQAAEDSDEASLEATPQYEEHAFSLTFGAELDDGDIVLKSSAADYYVLVRDTTANVFIDLRHEDLVKPPEPEPAGE